MFILTGGFSAQAFGSLRSKGSAQMLEARFEAIIGGLGGTLVHFLFVAGDTRFVAIIDLPRPAVLKFMVELTAGDLVTAGSLRLNRIRTDPAEVDAELERAEALGQPWPTADIGSNA